MRYLSRRGGSSNWYYRESVPADIREILVRHRGASPKEVWVSLGTPDFRIAKTKLPFVRAEQHRKWAEARQVAAPIGTVPSIGEMTDAVVDYVHAKFIEGHKANLRAQLQAGVDPSHEANRRRAKIIQAELYPTPDDVAVMERLANALCRTAGWDLGSCEAVRGERWSDLVAMVTKAVQHARSKVVETLEGRPHDTSRDAIIQHIGGGKRHLKAKSGETLLELFELYAKDRLRDGKSADTLEAERKIIGHFASFVGNDRSVGDIKRPDIREFKRALSRVPHRWVTRKELAGMPLAGAANQWEALGGTGRAQRTVARELSAVSSLFSWLIENAYVDDENPTAGFRPRFDKKAAKYPPYTEAQLKELFGGPLFNVCDKTKPWLAGTHQVRDWRYWLPLCALYTGARTGEIAQLLCADVREEQGIWVFDFNDDGNEGKSLKTSSSQRIVPVHPALIALGFSNYVSGTCDAGHKQLFPDIQPGPRGDWSYRPSKFWQKYLKGIGMKVRGLGLHSFRHGFVDECRRNRVSKEVVQSLLGHSDGSMTTHYGSIPWGTLIERKEAICSLSYGGIHDNTGVELQAA